MKIQNPISKRNGVLMFSPVGPHFCINLHIQNPFQEHDHHGSERCPSHVPPLSLLLVPSGQIVLIQITSFRFAPVRAAHTEFGRGSPKHDITKEAIREFYQTITSGIIHIQNPIFLQISFNGNYQFSPTTSLNNLQYVSSLRLSRSSI